MKQTLLRLGGKKLNKDRYGYSLVELIVVIAIMSIMIGVAGLGIGLISGKPAQQCAQKVVYSMERSRMLTQGKTNVTYKLYVNNKGQIVCDETIDGVTTTNVVGDAGVSVYYKLSGGDFAEEQKLSSTQFLVFAFDRSSGGFKETEIHKNGVKTTAKCTGLRMSKNGKNYEIKLVPLTGRITTDTNS